MIEATLCTIKLLSHFWFFDFFDFCISFYVGSGSESGTGSQTGTGMHYNSGSAEAKVAVPEGSGSTTLDVLSKAVAQTEHMALFYRRPDVERSVVEGEEERVRQRALRAHQRALRKQNRAQQAARLALAQSSQVGRNKRPVSASSVQPAQSSQVGRNKRPVSPSSV
jgi:hypothetical protein